MFFQDEEHSRTAPPNKVRSERTGCVYESQGVFGMGAFGTVFRARDITNDKTVAIKSIKSIGMGETEIQLMTNISDIKSVVKLLDYCTDLSFGGINYYLVMDFADGDLEFFVDELCDENDGNGYLQKNTDLRRYAAMLISGVQHLHKNKIIHRDLKPGNVLRFESDYGDYVLKISDFGISKKLEETINAGTTNVGTKRYMAPEVAISQEKYTTKVDVRSLGLLLFYLVTGRHR